MNENLKKVRNLYTWPRRLTFTNNCEKCSEVLIINFSRSRAYRSSKLKQGDKGHQNSNPPNYAIRDISQTWLEPIRSKKSFSMSRMNEKTDARTYSFVSIFIVSYSIQAFSFTIWARECADFFYNHRTLKALTISGKRSRNRHLPKRFFFNWLTRGRLIKFSEPGTHWNHLRWTVVWTGVIYQIKILNLEARMF